MIEQDQSNYHYEDVNRVKPFRVSSFDRLNPDECEAVVLRSILHEANGNLATAAKRLGLDEFTLAKKIRRYAV